MVQQCRKDLRLYGRDLWRLAALEIGCCGFGMVMVAIIMNVDQDPGGWFCMGSVISCIALVMFSLLYCGFSYPHRLMLALSMGRKRKHVVASYYLGTVLSLVLGWGLLVVLYRVELAVYTAAFPQYGNEVSLSFLTNMRIVVPAIVGLPVVAMFLGALIGKYGKKGYVFFYILWFFGCFVLPRMFDHDRGEGMLDQMAGGVLHAFKVVPAGAWLVCAVVLLAGMAVAVYRFAMEQMVK